MAIDLKDKVIQGAIIIGVIHGVAHYVGEGLLNLTPITTIYLAGFVVAIAYYYLRGRY